ncbi:M48 family metalloprotease [Aquiflexum gelatinilyticum]|uniref:M48 family metalloprotease n=1 Tax=Aquiflexum gelatinilyticum TaxID=2961943 RepID=A0A9X2SZR8_9BACT|nr:M48 family metalloprotease [Aquiflexum gelatinilyticum]MCR9016804.1 M48 family metalloprotease [Aquiflexum gelatinilyticum]
MKRYLLLLVFVLVANFSFSQSKVTLKGYVIRPFGEFAVGDTVTVWGTRKNINTGAVQYYIRSSFGEYRYFNEDRISLLGNDLDFWENVWMENRAETINKKGWESGLRQELIEDAMDYYSQALANNMVLQDDMLYDYVYQLIYSIHPYSMLKDRASDFSLVILNSTEHIAFSFDNGMIVLTTGLIASTGSENELNLILAQCIAHAVLEHNLVNLNEVIRAERRARIWGTVATVAAATAMAVDEVNNGVYHDYSLAADFGMSVYFLSSQVLDNLGAGYTSEQQLMAKKIASQFMDEHPQVNFLDDQQYLNTIASAVSITAWQEYQLKNYSYAQLLALKLAESGMASDTDYLLLSRIQRRKSNEFESNQLAMEYLKTARKLALDPLPELDKEEGLIYARLQQHEKSIAAYLKYRDSLLELKAEGKNVESELRMINQYLQRNLGQKASAMLKESDELD